jgi:peptide/nickel transport system permease protein/oligopeptide transport system permease protein
LLQFIPTVLGTMFLLHYMVSLGIQLNGNPARAVFGDRRPSPELLAAVKRQFNTDDPCLERTGDPCLGMFVERLGNMAQGQFGTDFRGRAVTEILSDAAPITLKLALIGFIVQVIIGLLAGVLAGLRGGGFWDYVVKISTVLIISIPVFVLGALVQLGLGVKFGVWLKGQEWVPDTLVDVFTVSYRPTSPWASLVIPGVVLGALGLATTARLTRTSLMENMRADYVRTAVAKGLERKRVIGVHTLRNSLIPVVTDLGLTLGGFIGGAVVTEGIFNIPGVGGTIVRAATRNEAPVIIGVTSILVLSYLLANLLVDMLYAVLDPRIRYD